MKPDRVARIRQDRAAVRRPEKGRRLGIDAPWDCELARPEGLLPGARWNPVRDREIPGRSALSRNSGWRPRPPTHRRPRSSPRRSCRLPGQMFGHNLSPSFQLGHHRHERRRDARLPRGDREDGLRLRFATGVSRSTVWRLRVRHCAASGTSMLALARLKRKMRLVRSPYRTPANARPGGPRSDAALAASSAARRLPWKRWAGSADPARCEPRCPKLLGLAGTVGRHYQLGERLRASCGRGGPVRMCWNWPSSATGRREAGRCGVRPDQDRHGKHPDGARSEPYSARCSEAADD